MSLIAKRLKSDGRPDLDHGSVVAQAEKVATRGVALGGSPGDGVVRVDEGVGRRSGWLHSGHDPLVRSAIRHSTCLARRAERWLARLRACFAWHSVCPLVWVIRRHSGRGAPCAEHRGGHRDHE
jgi:hypothetical protein